MTFMLEPAAKSGRARSSIVTGSRRIDGLAAAVALAIVMGSTGEAAAWGFLFDDPAPAPVYSPERTLPRAKKVKRKGVDARAQKTLREKLPQGLSTGLLQIVISIDTQRLTLYSNGAPIAHSMVATGVPGHPTPTGIFSVIEKQRFHRSNLYSDAPMPYMQRITWSGVALHEGVVPGHPASHGCIRMPAAFARQMWTTTKVAARVIIAHGDVVPVEITHAKLFVPKTPQDIRPQPGVPVADQPARRVDAAGTVKTAEMTDPSVATDAVVLRGPVKDGAGRVKAALIETVWTATVSLTERVASSLKTAEAAFEARLTDTIKIADAIAVSKKAADHTKTVDEMRKAGPISVYVSRKEKKIFVRHKFTPLFEAPVTFTEPNVPLGTHLYTAIELKDGSGAMRWNVATMPTAEQPAPAPLRKRSRRGGLGDTAETLATSAPALPPTAALAALDRIEIRQETLDRIAELLTPGASLIISDQGLGPETGRGTDFIVVTR